MTNYTFSELLNIFFFLQQNSEKRKTQEDLATELKIGKRTVANWFSGNYLPRSPDLVEQLARSLCLNAFQADLLFYSIDPAWVKYGTPHSVLEATEVIRYREEDIEYERELVQPIPSVIQIEREWSLVFEDQFETNYRRWGIGIKNNGICHLERSFCGNRYVLDLENQYHDDIFMGGDSNCFTPKIYYFTVTAEMIQGNTEDDGYAIFFEEISDECNAMFRVREKLRKASVVQTFDGADNYTVYLRQIPVPSMRSKGGNKLAILAIHNEHWFFINDALIGQHIIPRLSVSRLDIGIVAGSQQHVICHFKDFRVFVPPATKAYPTLVDSIETFL